MSGNKTWVPGFIQGDENTRQIRSYLQEAFDDENPFCFNQLKEKAKETKFNDLNQLDQNSITQQIKRKNPIDWSSAAIDWYTPRKYAHYQLVKNPLIAFRTRLSTELPSEGFEPGIIYCRVDIATRTLSYKLLNPNDPQHPFEGEISPKQAQFLSKPPIEQITLDSFFPDIFSIITRNGHAGPYLRLHYPDANNFNNMAYQIHIPSGEVQDGQILLASCDLIKTASKHPINWDDIKGRLDDQDAVILTDDNKLYFADYNNKSLGILNSNSMNRDSYDALVKRMNQIQGAGTKQTDVGTRLLIERVTAEGSAKGRTFPVDDVRNALNESKNAFDERLRPVYDEITQSSPDPLATYPRRIEDSSDQIDQEFIKMIKGFKPVLSNAEFLKYHLAYRKRMSELTGKTKFVIPNQFVFQKEMNERLYQDTRTELTEKLKRLKSKIPPETLQLIQALIKSRDPSYAAKLSAYTTQDSATRQKQPGATTEDKIHFLRTVSLFLDTTWCQGSALTEYAPQTALREYPQTTMGPYVKNKVLERQALPIDERMPEYDIYKWMFASIPQVVKKYNFNAEYARAKAALQPKFYAPQKLEQFNEIQLQGRNCFVLYENKLYYINSDRTMRKIAVNLKESDPATRDLFNHPLTMQLDQPGQKSSAYAFKERLGDGELDCYTSKLKAAYILYFQTHGWDGEQRWNLYHQRQENRLEAIESKAFKTRFDKQYNLDTEIHKPLGKEYIYSEPQMQKLLGKEFPNDPNLKLAREMMERAYQGTSIIEYLRSARRIAPKFGKFASMVDDSTMIYKLRTKAGREDSKTKYAAALEKQRSTWRAWTTDTFSSAYSQERIDAFNTTTRIAQSDLSLNQNIEQQTCGLRIWSDAKMLSDDRALAELPNSSWVIINGDNEGNIYFVDKSNPIPQVTSTKKPELHQKLGHLLDVVENPQLADHHDQWDKYGYDHAEKGFSARVFKLPSNDQALSTEENRKKLARKGQVLIFQETGVWKIGFLGVRNIYQEKTIEINGLAFNEKLDKYKQDGFILNEYDIKIINQLLADNSSSYRVPYRQKTIANISPQLSTAITQASTSLATGLDREQPSSTILGPKTTVYDPYIEKYQYNEAANRLTYIIAQREKLWDQYTATLQPLKQEIEKIPNTVFTAQKPMDNNQDPIDKVYIWFDAKNNQFMKTQYRRRASSAHIQEESAVIDRQTLRQEYKIPANIELPDLKKTNLDLAIQYYDVKILTPMEFNQLQYWSSHQKEKPPIELRPGVLYLGCQEARGNTYTCMSMNTKGEFAQTEPNIGANHIFDTTTSQAFSRQRIIQNIFSETVASQLIPSPSLVSPDFLARCVEAQQFMQDLVDAGDHSLVPITLVPMEQRLRMIEMMRACVENPESDKARHYLRSHHKLYFYDSEVAANTDQANREKNCFYLIGTDNPRLFFTDGSGHTGLMNVKPFTEKKLLAKRKGRDSSIDLSCEEVYQLITNRSSYFLDAIPLTANNEIDRDKCKPGTLYIYPCDQGLYYVVRNDGELKTGIIPDNCLPTKSDSWLGFGSSRSMDVDEILISQNDPKILKTLLAYTAQQGHTSTGKIKMDTAQELLAEIKATELNLWKALESLVCGLLMVAIAVFTLGLIPIPFLGAGSFIGGATLVFNAITVAGLALLTLTCIETCVVNSEWLQPGLSTSMSRLQQKLQSLEVEKLAFETIAQTELAMSLDPLAEEVKGDNNPIVNAASGHPPAAPPV